MSAKSSREDELLSAVGPDKR